jgi:ribonucleoside-triphosphate reductase
MSSIDVVKRDGSVEEFDVDKVSDSIMQAAMRVGGEDADLADELADQVLGLIESNGIEKIESSEIQELVEKTLIEEGHASTAKIYILKSADRNRMREMDTALMKSFEEITFKSEEESDIKRENANIDSSTAMGTMLKYGSEGAKNFNLLYMMSEDIADAHRNGDIHIHDLDFLTLTMTCCQIPLDKLYEGGFNTGHGFLRQPGGIRAAASLAAIAIQSDQNDQHGGQSIPMLDYYLAPYVALTYAKSIAHVAKIKFDLNDSQYKSLKETLVAYQKSKVHIMGTKEKKELKNIIKEWFDRHDYKVSLKRIDKLLESAYDDTYDETFQAMEAFIHNLNTMHSRAGRRTNMVEVPVTWETLCPAV